MAIANETEIRKFYALLKMKRAKANLLIIQ